MREGGREGGSGNAGAQKHTTNRNFVVNWKWKGLATLFGNSRSFTAACMGGRIAFFSFPPL